ncbi:hypothetical protein IAQ61_008494 [Plenodomus lingam]|uniref:uncharacterized protein n=1 Tax=Leptosphaeria maculans TaxID=5022 RepID=UPI00332314EA|nr:hypothetical protein IAQ61_008494 [Plenodomus lingam]
MDLGTLPNTSTQDWPKSRVGLAAKLGDGLADVAVELVRHLEFCSQFHGTLAAHAMRDGGYPLSPLRVHKPISRSEVKQISYHGTSCDVGLTKGARDVQRQTCPGRGGTMARPRLIWGKRTPLVDP